MSEKFLRCLLRFSVIFISVNSQSHYRQDFSLLINFTCAVAKDELEKHPEMQTIALVELENNFPPDFSAKVLKCLPQDVAKVSLNPHPHIFNNNSIVLPRQSMIIYVAKDEVEWLNPPVDDHFMFYEKFPMIHHLSKHLIVSSNPSNKPPKIIRQLLNVVQISEQNQKVIARSFDRTKNSMTLDIFNKSQHGNLSQVLFPDKVKNLNGQILHAAFIENHEVNYYRSKKLNSKWTLYLDIIEEKFNMKVKIIKKRRDGKSHKEHVANRNKWLSELYLEGKLDFYLNAECRNVELTSYNYFDWCFLVPLPKPFSIYEQILFLPMDKSCWMWLSITTAVSTLVWRISEGHWNFLFGAFSYFVGQSQLVVRIRTSRPMMKVLLQILILAFFIFSNGYQSFVTSFMLNPMQVKLLSSLDEILDSDLNIELDKMFYDIQQENPKYQKATKDGRVIDIDAVMFGSNWDKEYIRRNLVFLQQCKTMKYRIEHRGDGKSWHGFYLIPSVVYSTGYDFYTTPFHPYIDKLQEIMDRTFEAGLHQAWENFFFMKLFRYQERISAPEDKTILDFEAIGPFFLILAVGSACAFLGLLWEIFYHDFIAELSPKYFKKRIKNPFKREIKIRKRKAKLRRIQVKSKVRKNHIRGRSTKHL